MVCTKVGLAELGQIFLRSDPKVLVLISHAHDDYVELHDGMIKTDRVLSAIPKSYAGTVDLCVCHSRSLAMEIKEKRPRVIVKFSQNAAQYTLWFGVYSVVFTHIAKKNFVHYSDALDETLDKMIPS